MEFNEIKKNWNQQSAGSKSIVSKENELLYQQIRGLEKRNHLLLFIVGFISLVACLALLFWAYLFLHYGEARMREMDIYPPFGWFIMFPFYVAIMGIYVIYRHFLRNKKSDFNQSLT